MSALFDPESGLFRLDEIVAERPTFKKIMADEVVTDEELQSQAELSLALLKRIEVELDPKAKQLVEETLAELAVLYAVSHYHSMQWAKGLSNL